MPSRRALWVSTSTETRGGIATYVREMQRMPLWNDWNIRHVTTHRDGSAATKAVVFAWGAIVFVSQLARFRPGVVHLHSSADASFVRKAILFWISHPFGIPVVIHMHGSDFQDYYDRSGRLAQSVIGATLTRANAVVALGEVWADKLRAIAPQARVIVIPNAVRPARRTVQPARNRPLNVVFLGRIGDRKGAFRLLDSWADLVSRPTSEDGSGRAVSLTIAGDGEVATARRRIQELGVGDSVELREWLTPEAVDDLLGKSQVLVLPSRNEGQPMAVLEAMARGLCVVASDVGGLPEMIGDGCGVIVSAEDGKAISDALKLVIDDDQLRLQFGAAAHARFADRFDVRAVARQIDDLYCEVAR